MSELRKYGAATTLVFPLVERDGTDFTVSPVFVAGDVLISKDEGAFVNIGTLPTSEGNGSWSVPLTATEAQAARIVILIKDQTATKVWEDQAIIIETYGHASAQHAFDLDLAEQQVDVVKVSGDSGAADNLEADYDGTGYDKSASTIRSIGDLTVRRNTARTGSANTIRLDAGASATEDIYVGEWVTIVGGTGAGQSRLILAYNGTTKNATIAPDWETTPDATSVFLILPAAFTFADVQRWRGGGTLNALVDGRVDASVGAMASGVLTVAATASAWFLEAADRLLDRPISNVEPGAVFRTLYGAIASLVNRRRINAGNVEVFRTDDVTNLANLAITEDAGQEPISELDP